MPVSQTQGRSYSSGQASRIYLVRSAPDRNGYFGEYSFPGRDVQRVIGNDGRHTIFNTEDEAIAAAGEELCKALNGRVKSKDRGRYTRLGGADFAVALHDLNITPGSFAKMYGTNPGRVQKWIDGEEEIPHPVRILLATFTLPGALPLAKQLTAANLINEEL